MYLIIGGFRTVTGICFLGVVIPFYLILTAIYPVGYSEFRHLLPIWNHSPNEIFEATKDMTLSYLGFSTLFMFYPYIKHPRRSIKWAQLGSFLSLLLYTFIMIISITYFDVRHLIHNTWPTLNMWKIVELPFVERFEYIGISSWTLIILPNVCLAFWASSRGIRQVFRFSQRKALIGMMVVSLIILLFLKEREQIELLSKYVSLTGLYLCSFYVPCLLILSYFKWRRKDS